MNNNTIDQNILKKFIEQELDYDLSLFSQLFEIYKNYANEFNSLEQNPLNLEISAKTAHKIRSSCLSFGATNLAENLAKLETAAQNNDQEASQNYFNQIKIELFSSIDSINEYFHLNYLKEAV